MSFIEISENSKIAALEHKFEKLDVYNCWASSRWEHAYIYTCINWVDSTVTIFGRSIKINVPYVEKCTKMIFTSYPCNSAIPNKGNWYWMSEKL